MQQQTIERAVSCTGVGLHSGRRVSLRLNPAAEDTGVVFAVNTGAGARFLNLHPDTVQGTGLATTLGQGEVRVATVEHLMAAIRAMGIDNILVEIDGGEVPIMDGSAASFVMLLRDAGVRQQRKAPKVWAIKRRVSVEEEGRWIVGEPFPGFCVQYTIDFAHPLVGVQTRQFHLAPEEFEGTVARARTFGFLHEVEKLKQHNLALGGSLDNAIVLDEYGVVNPEGLRFADEFVRHKILDFIGDMALLDGQLWGKFTVHCSGHALNNSFLRHIYENKDQCLEYRQAPGVVKDPAFEPELAGQKSPVVV